MTYLQQVHNRHQYLPLLLLADESETLIAEYINKGEMYTICEQDHSIGVCLFIFPAEGIVELKNIAIVPDRRGTGIGKQVLTESCTMFQKRGFREIIVGTANSSLENIAFYQKCGFRMNSIRRDFFCDYPTPLYENGIRALDMIVFSKELT
ncbi:GNAT family N-acetyltransferase [Halobacillus andaensis]|uniref:GNAT family N-acetyltransferase n=1 Tax=Halobacillus andaensis TaxID=1176239 RepID=UPI003D75241D